MVIFHGYVTMVIVCEWFLGIYGKLWLLPPILSVFPGFPAHFSLPFGNQTSRNMTVIFDPFVPADYRFDPRYAMMMCHGRACVKPRFLWRISPFLMVHHLASSTIIYKWTIFP
jgi:hypothetical protein